MKITKIEGSLVLLENYLVAVLPTAMWDKRECRRILGHQSKKPWTTNGLTLVTYEMDRHIATIAVVMNMIIWITTFFCVLQPNPCLDHIMVEGSGSHTIRHTHLIELVWMSDKLIAEAATYTTQQTQETNIPPPPFFTW